ncbi:MAG: tetratricopeptide repeat protein [Acidiferrobacterales bacterium]
MVDKQQVLALLQGNRLNEARELGTALCENNRNDPEAWFLLAGVHAQLGVMDEVIRCCGQVIALEPGNAAARYNLGVALQMRGRYQEAVETYGKMLEVQPDAAPVLANLALALRELGRSEEALPHCQRAVTLQPGLAEAHNTLGLLFMDQGRTTQALECFRQATALRPQYAEAHFNLGLCHQALGNLAEAQACFQQAIRWRPDYPEAHSRLGAVLISVGKREEAVHSYQCLVHLRPDAAQAHRDLGVLLASLHRWDEAISHYRRAIELKPDYADAYNDLGNALLDSDPSPKSAEQGAECFREALRYKPEAPGFHLSLAMALTDIGRYDEADASYRSALHLKPDFPLAAAGLAMLLERKGDFEASYALLKPLVDAGTDNIYVALSYAALAGRFDCRAQAAVLLERMLQQPRDERQQVDGHFALGKLYDELQDYPRAFEHFRHANSLDPRQFDEKQYLRDFDTLIGLFCPERIRHRPRASNRSKLPVFIVGMPRSGTSLTEQILASHPLVYGAGELPDITNIVSRLQADLGASNPYPQCLDALTGRNIDPIAQRHLDRLVRFSSDAVRVTDKMPHNFLYLGLIDLLFPGARIIHCLRDPVDTCLSIYVQPFNGHFNALHPYAHDLRSLGRYYRLYQRLMAHWKSVVRVPLMEFQYEELVDNQEAMSRRLVEFCELDWDDRCLRFHETARVVKTASHDQVRRPIYRKSVARWKNYEQFLGPLIDALEDQDIRQQ